MAVERRETPEELRAGRALRLYARALTLRCPNCGEPHIHERWLALRPRCPGCGLITGRGGRDFFLGGIMFNYIFCGLFLLAAVVVVMAATWPGVPWALLQWGGIALMLGLPLVFYPFSLTTWLASDILIKPVTPEELQREPQGEPPRFSPPR